MNDLIDVLNGWRELNREIASLNEDELEFLLDYELGHARRTTVMLRLHQKFNTLRSQRERREIMKETEVNS